MAITAEVPPTAVKTSRSVTNGMVKNMDVVSAEQHDAYQLQLSVFPWQPHVTFDMV
jgi:hypothetical protein